MSKTLFITGTDTNSGKTYVSNLIIQALRLEKVDAVGYKPICCGDRNDAVLLGKSSNIDDLDLINPYWLKTPAAPHVAAMFENKTISRDTIKEHYTNLMSQHEVVIAEGAGGWLVPINGMQYTMADLAQDLECPVLLVVGNKLGALNHALLTVESMRARNIEPAGFVFNNLSDELDTATITNKGIIEDLTGIEVLTDVIHEQESIESWPIMDILGL